MKKAISAFDEGTRGHRRMFLHQAAEGPGNTRRAGQRQRVPLDGNCKYAIDVHKLRDRRVRRHLGRESGGWCGSDDPVWPGIGRRVEQRRLAITAE